MATNPEIPVLAGDALRAFLGGDPHAHTLAERELIARARGAVQPTFNAWELVLRPIAAGSDVYDIEDGTGRVVDRVGLELAEPELEELRRRYVAARRQYMESSRRRYLERRSELESDARVDSPDEMRLVRLEELEELEELRRRYRTELESDARPAVLPADAGTRCTPLYDLHEALSNLESLEVGEELRIHRAADVSTPLTEPRPPMFYLERRFELGGQA